jgi:hypothetical protein
MAPGSWVWIVRPNLTQRHAVRRERLDGSGLVRVACELMISVRPYRGRLVEMPDKVCVKCQQTVDADRHPYVASSPDRPPTAPQGSPTATR